jgi:preprotein translocase subunit SecY
MPEEKNRIISAIQNIFTIPDLRKRVLYMLGILAVYRIGAFIPTPGVDNEALRALFETHAGSIFGFLDIFSGGSLSRFSIFALGIMPYITASIILQLATVVVPHLEKLSKEGELGRKKITQYTRYLTIVLTLIQGLMTAFALERSGGATPIVLDPGWGFRLTVMITLTTGTAFIM